MMDSYTRVLELAAEANDEKVADEAVHKLIAHLKSNGRIKMLPQLLTELRTIAARRKSLQAQLEVASEAEKSSAVTAAKAAGIDAQTVRITPSLISGWRARANGNLIDRSGKRALIDIYQKVTS